MRVEPDFLMRVVVKNPAVRMAFGSFRELTAEGIIRHDADPVSGRLLAGAFVSAALMSVLLDDDEKFSIRIDYDGPAKGILTDVDVAGNVRGFIRNPHVMAEADSMEIACGNGAKVAVTRSCNGRILNSGQSESAFITPSSALSYYLSVSDQVESEIRAEITLQPDPKSPVRRAYGVMIQALPGCSLEVFDHLRQQLLMPAVGKILNDPLTDTDRKLEALLMFLCSTANPPDAAVFKVPAAKFHCGCSGEKIWKTAIEMLGQDDFKKLLSENSDPVIRCQFCNTEYHLK